MGSSKSRTVVDLTENQIEELSRKTKYKRDEILNLHSEFIRDCPSGKLDKKSFSKIYKELFPYGDSSKFCNICFLAYDKARGEKRKNLIKIISYLNKIEFFQG